MAAREKTNQPTNRTLRQLSWIAAGAMALTGHLVGPSPEALVLQLAAAVVFAVGTVRPSAMRTLGHVAVLPFRLGWRLGAWLIRTYADRRPPAPPSRRSQVANSGV